MSSVRLNEDFTLRPAGPEDQAAAYEVCLKTGDSGRDGAHLYPDDPSALGNLYVGPYLSLEPDLAFVLEDGAGVCGYLLGALDSARFYQRLLAEWLPPLRARHPDPTGDPARWTPTQWLYHEFHHFTPHYPPAFHAFPSHLHIDLLPHAQGRGLGRRMIGHLLALLAARGSPGAHLGLSAANERAHRFYRQLGFTELERTGERAPQTVYMARALP